MSGRKDAGLASMVKKGTQALEGKKWAAATKRSERRHSPRGVLKVVPDYMHTAMAVLA